MVYILFELTSRVCVLYLVFEIRFKILILAWFNRKWAIYVFAVNLTHIRCDFAYQAFFFACNIKSWERGAGEDTTHRGKKRLVKAAAGLEVWVYSANTMPPLLDNEHSNSTTG